MAKGEDTRHHENRKVSRQQFEKMIKPDGPTAHPPRPTPKPNLPRTMSIEEYAEQKRAERPDLFGEGKQAGIERQLPLTPSGLTASEENTWKEGYDFGEYQAGVPYDERNMNPKGQ